MRRIFLTIEYNGTGYFGWQRVADGPSVQHELETALGKLTQQTIETFAAGRTDRGVHARSQVAHFDLEKDLDLIKILDGLNHYLPADIRILRVDVVPERYHARFSATSRAYRYTILQRRMHAPLRPDAIQAVPSLDTASMRAAAQSIPPGENDWSAFRSSECQSSTPMVNLQKLDLTIHEDAVILDLAANHFLHNMVRILAGTLIEIGQGKRPVDDFPRLLASRDRTQSGYTAPPNGLVLESVTYPDLEVLETCP